MVLDLPSPGDDRSYWLQEALAADGGRVSGALRGRVAADVCIVGGGFAGLWTAVALSEREPHLRIAILESDICGGGASGRNGGFSSSSWWDLAALVGLFGAAEGLAYAQHVSDQVGEIGDWVRANGVDCWYHREGILVAEAGESQRGGHRTDVEMAASLGVPDRIYRVTPEEARSHADSPRFVGGAFVPDCAICQPARLARGIRRVLIERGVHVFEGTKVSRVEHGTPAIVRTEEGAIRADQVVLTMGAWGASWPGFRRAFADVVDYVVATEPITERLRAIGWTSNVGIGDSREMLYYLRTTEDGRIVIGGGAMGVIFGGNASGRAATHDRRVAEQAARGLLWLFPQLEGVRFTHAWGGPIDETAASVPFFQTLRPGNVHAGLGFSGHGLTQTRLGGKVLSSLVLGADDEWARLPVVGPPLGKVPPEPLRYPLTVLAARAMEAGDRAADAGRRPGPVSRLVSRAVESARPWPRG